MLRIKDLCGRCVGDKVTIGGVKSFEELEGLPGGRAWSRAQRIVPVISTIMAYRYS